MRRWYAVDILQIRDILILLRYNIKINTTKSCEKELNFHALQLSWNFPLENLASIHAKLFKWKEKLRQVEITHGLIFEFLESSTSPHIESLFHVTIYFSSYLSDNCSEKKKVELGNFGGVKQV